MRRLLCFILSLSLMLSLTCTAFAEEAVDTTQAAASEENVEPAGETPAETDRDTGDTGSTDTGDTGNTDTGDTDLGSTDIGNSETGTGETETPPADTETGTGSTETTPDNTETTPDNTETTPDNTVTTPDGTETTPDNTVTTPDSTATTPDNTVTTPDNTATTPDNTVTTPETPVRNPDNTVTPPGSMEIPAQPVIPVPQLPVAEAPVAEEAVISVETPTSAHVIINPYRMKVSLGGVESTDPVVSRNETVRNYSSVPVSMEAAAWGSSPAGSGAVLVTAPPAADASEKEIFMYMEFRALDDEYDTPSWSGAFRDAGNQIVVNGPGKSGVMELPAASLDGVPGCGAMRLFGDTAVSPEKMWEAGDVVNVTVAFTFTALAEEALVWEAPVTEPVEIQNPTGIQESEGIQDSEGIQESEGIQDSEGIQNSEETQDTGEPSEPEEDFTPVDSSLEEEANE